MGKIRVEELAAQMGIGSKEVLFLLQSIGVDVQSPQAALDETTVLAILQGKTHAPKQLIVRDPEAKAFRPQKSALSRIKIVEKTAPPKAGAEAEPAPAPRAEPRAKTAAPAEPARTAVVPPEPEPEAAKPPAPSPPRKIALPPRPTAPPAGARATSGASAGLSAGSPRPAPTRPAGPSGPGRPMGPSGPPLRPTGPSVYRPAPGAPRPMGPRPGGPLRPGGPPGRPGAAVGRTAPPAASERTSAKRKKDDKEEAKKPAKKGGAKPKITVADEVDLREFVGAYEEDTYSDITLPLIEKTAETDEAAAAAVEPRPMSKSALRRAAKETRAHDSGKLLEFKKPLPTGPVFLSEGVTVKELSEKLGVLAKDIVRLLLQRGVMATINQPLDAATAIQLAKEVGVEAAVVSFEEEMELSRTPAGEQAPEAGARAPRAPVVTVMGHVDHGKTSLLDAIRQTKVAQGEAGGITQHIGAYRAEVQGRPIVFLDTPGHEAFTSMRARGAKATDIVVLVVAADDGVMPQTIEAIDHARAAKVPIVVAINKIDKPNANPDRVKKELADRGVLLESWGGDVPSAEISALKKQGIEHLLELILLSADLLELSAPLGGDARGVVLEARREAGRGNIATVLVQSGTLRVGDVFFAGSAFGRVRSMHDDRGEKLSNAGPAT
ncbi:MAG TPA: translation initiation factor IF-2, partial [Thermoanaerobaculia bacterium]|nr:translation initiation factor IF-2 [Thermoanaerobaculia bacterium]